MLYMQNKKPLSLKKVCHIFLFIWIFLSSTQPFAQIKRSDVIPDSISVWNLKLKNYIQKVDTEKPTITGGCVILTNSALSTSILLMALDISLKKEHDAARKEKIENLISILRPKRDSLETMADKDNVIFQNFLNTYRLPHNTPKEIKLRDTAINGLLIEATKSPLDSARLILRILSTWKDAYELTSKNVLSDVKASGILLNATFDAIIIIANDNITMLSESDRHIYETSRDTTIQKEKLFLDYILKQQ